jgi:hypothetical protein
MSQERHELRQKFYGKVIDAVIAGIFQRIQRHAFA